MESECFVYGLTDPRDGVVRYVGATTIGRERLRSHRYPRTKDRSLKDNWVRDLSDVGLEPQFVVLEDTTPSDMWDVEKFWIAQLRGMGVPLTNVHDTPKTTSHRKKISVALTGLVRGQQTDEHRNKIAKSHGTRRFADETGRVFDSIASAARAHDMDRALVLRSLKGQIANAKGHQFKWVA